MDFNNSHWLGKIKVVMVKGEKGDKGEKGEAADYTKLQNLPQINGVTLTGNKTAAQLDIATTAQITSATNIANTAKSTADAAKNTADGIASTAQSALSTANSANTTAQAVQSDLVTAEANIDDARNRLLSVEDQVEMLMPALPTVLYNGEGSKGEIQLPRARQYTHFRIYYRLNGANNRILTPSMSVDVTTDWLDSNYNNYINLQGTFYATEDNVVQTRFTTYNLDSSGSLSPYRTGYVNIQPGADSSVVTGGTVGDAAAASNGIYVYRVEAWN